MYVGADDYDEYMCDDCTMRVAEQTMLGSWNRVIAASSWYFYFHRRCLLLILESPTYVCV